MKHDGYTNKYSLVHNNRTFTLVPLTPQQVHEDATCERERQKKMSAQEKESENAKRKSEHRGKEREKMSDEKHERS